MPLLIGTGILSCAVSPIVYMLAWPGLVMGTAIINPIGLVSCLLGLGIGYWLLRWSRRELATLATERQRLFKRKLGLWGRRAHAGSLLLGAIAILYFSAVGLLALLTRQW